MAFTEAVPGAAVGTGRACGKAILIGEHTVVYGLPAVALPVPGLSAEAAVCASTSPVSFDHPARWGDTGRDAVEARFVCAPGTTTDSGAAAAVAAALRHWEIESGSVGVSVRSAIPPARGLGSSAAGAVAAVRAVADLYGKSPEGRELYELVQCGERVAHGRASGIDAAAVTAPGPIHFRAGVARPQDSGLDAVLVIADSGVPGSTRQAVDTVWESLHRDRANAQRLLARAAEVIDAASAELAAGSTAAVGLRLIEFQALLRELGVSTPALDRLVAAALRAGAHGAKLTGGGLGGCVVALTDPDAASTVRSALQAAGACRTWAVPMRGWSQ
ncbi:mevalonate kinase [Nocardia thraciensis]